MDMSMRLRERNDSKIKPIKKRVNSKLWLHVEGLKSSKMTLGKNKRIPALPTKTLELP
jgi:hypothetical protein